MLMDLKSMKKHLANGTSLLPYFDSIPLPRRQSSEPPSSTMSSRASFAFESPLQLSKDDAYQIFDYEGKKASGAQPARPTPSSLPNARQLLDPKGFDKSQRQEKTPAASSESGLLGHSNSTLPTPHLNRGLPEVNGNSNGNGLEKRNYDDYEGQGMGSLIERVHNISQRQERPQKKQRSETFDEDEKERKAAFAGGGKGGEIGEYMEQKKKEGLEESGPVSAVVDLTGGTSTWPNPWTFEY